MPTPRGPHKLANTRRLVGKEILRHVPSFYFEGDGTTPVTQARVEVRQNEITAPALISIRRNEFTVDHFYLSSQGMFGVDYVEYNYRSFAELTRLQRQLFEKGEFRCDPDQRFLVSLANHEYEAYKPEYAFV